MAQYWYKKDKRIKRTSDILSNQEVKSLKDNGYVRIKSRSNVNDLYDAPKPKPKKVNKKVKKYKKSKKK